MTAEQRHAVPATHPRSLRELWTWLAEDYRVNRRRAGVLSVVAVVVFRLSQYGSRGDGPSAAIVRLLSLPLVAFTRLTLGVELPGALACGRRLVLPHGGRGVVVNPDARLGDDVCLMHQVTIGNAVPDLACPVLGSGVFVGVKASVLGGVTVGDGATVGAHALVLKSVPPGAVAIGVPATCTPRRLRLAATEGTRR